MNKDAQVFTRTGDCRGLTYVMQFRKQYVLSFLRKEAIVIGVFLSDKAFIPYFELSYSFLVLGTLKRCCEITDLSCLWILERRERLAKQGTCCVDRAWYVRVYSLNLIRYVTGSECNWLSRDGDG